MSGIGLIWLRNGPMWSENVKKCQKIVRELYKWSGYGPTWPGKYQEMVRK